MLKQLLWLGDIKKTVPGWELGAGAGNDPLSPRWGILAGTVLSDENLGNLKWKGHPRSWQPHVSCLKVWKECILGHYYLAEDTTALREGHLPLITEASIDK